jgi:hypothetical protein
VDELERLLWDRRVVGLASLLLLIAGEARDRAREAGDDDLCRRWRRTALYWAWRAASARGERTSLDLRARNLDPGL